MTVHSFPPVVVCGASPTGLAIARDVGRNGIDVVMADFDHSRPAFGSKYCRRYPPIVSQDSEALVDRLVEFAKDFGERPVLLQSSDVMVELVSEYRSNLECSFTIPDSIRTEVSGQFLDKARFYDVCSEHGIPTPKTAFPQSLHDLISNLDDFQFPLILKPILGHVWRDRLRGKKLLVFQSRDEIESFIETIGEELSGLMVQELIPGPESNLWIGGYYSDCEGRVRCRFVGKKLRQHPYRFGSASLVESRWNSRVDELSEKLIDLIGYRGVCGTEFKFDERDGVYKAIEVNPRATLWFGVIAASNVPLHHYAYCDLAGLPTPEVGQQADGVRWLFFEKDLVTVGKQIMAGELSPISYLRSLRGVTSHAVFSPTDIMPTVRSLSYYARRILGLKASVQ